MTTIKKFIRYIFNKFKRRNKIFYCPNGSKLVSPELFPKIVGGNFICHNNRLKVLWE